MLQQITITSKSNVLLKPLLETALQNERKLLLFGIQKTKRRLEHFETRYEMPSLEFDRLFKSQEIEENLDFIDWQMELTAMKLLEEHYQALSGAKID